MSNSPRKRHARWLAVPAAALALFSASCGGGDDGKPSAKEPVKPAPVAAPAGNEQAVKDTILKWTFEGDCDLMTDKFLEQQAFIGDNRKERCDYFEKAFQKPQYSESDVKFRKVSVTGQKATATVGSDLANITTDYTLVADGGEWKIDEAG